MHPLKKVKMISGVDAAGYRKAIRYLEDYSMPTAAEMHLTDPQAHEEAGEWISGGRAAVAEAPSCSTPTTHSPRMLNRSK